MLRWGGRGPRILLRLVVLTTGLGLSAPALVPIAARAATCGPQGSGAYPNDPGYSPAENGYPTTSATWDGEQWYLYGCIPQDLQGQSADPEGASGMSVDRVWNDLGNKGRDDVKVAYMEGGVNWRIDTSCELKDRAWLNRGELPYPQNAQGKTNVDLGLPGDPYDLNGDGVFNVEDYVNDPRIVAAEVGMHRSPGDPAQPFLHQVCSGVGPGHSNITPEDLIVTFGHCQIQNGLVVQCPPGGKFDNDGNGYPNDINGWNFNRDTNDPQTEQSVYHHFDGESAQLVGEANNAFGNAGMCPLCRYIPIKAGDEAIDRPDRVAEAIVYAADTGVNVLDMTVASLGLTQSVKDAIDYAYHKGMVIAGASNDFESADHTDGMFYPHVWPGNSLTGDHSTRGSATCHSTPPAPSDALCAYVLGNTTFRSRSSLTSYGPHSLFSVPNNDGSTSTGTPTQAGVAALVVSEGLNAHSANPAQAALNADEVKQVVRSTASYIGPLTTCPSCFQGISGATFNIQYGYGRPNVFKAAQAVDGGKIPPTADIRSPDWYQEVDPTKQSSLSVSADVAAQRATGGAYSWELQYGIGAQPLDTAWHTFASGNAAGPQTVSGTLDLTQIPSSFWSGAYSVDAAGRTSIEQYDVTVRVHVFANGDTTKDWKMGEDRRAFHLRHDDSERAGFPVRIGSSGDSSPAMADIEGRGWLDTILATADGTLHAIRPDGTEAPGFPVHTGPAPGMDPSYDMNYLASPAWGTLTRPRDGILGPVAVGDLRHDGGLEIVGSTFSGKTYVWDGAGNLLPGFPVLNGSPALYHMSVPPPDTPYSFEPENVAGAAPVLADLEKTGQLDIVQGAGDNAVHAWRPDGTAVPGWPVSVLLPASAIPAGEQQTHDSKVVPTPAIVDINGNGQPDVVVGLVDTALGTGPSSSPITAYLEAFDGRGNNAPGGAMMPGYPAHIPGLIQGYGVAQDFVTQGVESPVVYDSSSGPQAVVNANLYLPVRVDLRTAAVSANPFAGATLPPTGSTSGVSPNGAMVQFTTSASIGKVVSSLPNPQVFQAGSAGADVVTGITQTPGAGIRVDNGLGAWDPSNGNNLSQFSQYIQGLAFFTAPAIADVTGDGTPDVIQSADSGALMAFDGTTGQPAAGFPKWSGGWSLWSPAVGDLMGSGTVSVAVATREGYLHAWDTPGKTSANHEAWHWHQDDRNTGHYGTDTRPPAAVRDLSVSLNGATDTLTFTAPGDDWNFGRAASYQIRSSTSAITQATFSAATPVPSSATPQTAGSPESIVVPHTAGQNFYAVRAVDAAGNIGPVQVLALSTNPGLLRVTSSPALPTQILVDGQIADSWGLNWMKIAPGPHTVCFTHVEGWTEPPCQPLTVTSGGTTTVTGSFIQRGQLRVITSPAEPSQISLDGNPTDDWGMWTDVPIGSHTVCFGAVAGFNSPACQTGTVSPGAQTTITGIFTTNPNAAGQSGLGVLRVTTSPAVPSQITIKAGAGTPYIADSWGLNWLELPPGSYVVSFAHVQGYTEPAPQTVTITAGNTTVVSANFTQRGFLRVTTSPAVAGSILVDGVPRDDWGIWSDIPTGSHTVCFGQAAGYANTPACQTVTVNPGVETDVTGGYS